MEPDGIPYPLHGGLRLDEWFKHNGWYRIHLVELMDIQLLRKFFVKMRRHTLVLLAVFAFATQAFAGKINGSITEGGKPVAQGIKVDVACGSNNYSAQTDTYGAFSVFARTQGKCILKVAYQGQTPSIEINSYEGSVQYDLILEKQGSQYTLKRK